MVWACEGPRWVAHTLQQLDGFSVGADKEVGDRESKVRLAQPGGWNQWGTSSLERLQSKSSTTSSTSRRIDRKRPGPRTSPECTGTVVLPSRWRRKEWLPLVRTTSKRSFSRMRMSSLPFRRGTRVIPRSAECRLAQGKECHDCLPSKARPLLERVSSVCPDS
jgi:hypothetical protein